MMESVSLEQENIIKDVRNLFRLEKLKKETIDTTIKDTKNLLRQEEENEEIKNRVFRDIRYVFRLKKENKVIKDKILRDIRNLFEYQIAGNYDKTVRVRNFWSNSYIEYQSNDDKNKALSSTDSALTSKQFVIKERQ